MIGQKLGPYEILAKLGEGGMGEVYRARDQRLERDVAVKVLREHRLDDPDAQTRFEREARAVAALSHPNILAIHDFGEHEGVAYAVTELLEGQSLLDELKTGPLPLRRAIDIAGQMADGLAAAHEKGIVHRDLKPANVFLTVDGRVKILDFGLAKAGPVSSADSLTATLQDGTAPGTVMGTVRYMSPEQVRGDEVDPRSDIFSFGTVLWEMLSGEIAFQRDSAVEIMNAILKEEPPDISARDDRIPASVERIIRRCMEKVPDQRFQSAQDLAFALRNSLDSTSRGLPALEAPAPTRRSRRGALVAGAVALFVVGLLGGAWFGANRLAPPPAPPARIAALTHSGLDSRPTASPDGRMIAFVSERDGRPRIWLRQMNGGVEVPLTEGPDLDPSFSPDGSSVLFLRNRDGEVSAWRVPVVGGTPRKIVDKASAATWAPDGQRIAISRVLGGAENAASGVFVRDLQSGEERQLLRREQSYLFGLRWSPDGRWLALIEGPAAQNATNSVLLVDAESGEVEWSRSGNAPFSAPAFSPDSRALVLARSEGQLGDISGSVGRVLRIDPFSDSDRTLFWVQSVWAGSGDYVSFDFLDANRLVFDEILWRGSLTTRPLDGGTGRSVTTGNSRDRQPAYSPDGRSLVFSSNRSGNADVWLLELGTGELRQITDDPGADWDPAFTADGRNVLFSSNRSGHLEIWRSRLDGSAARQITQDGVDAENPTQTPDGEWIVYGSGHPEHPGVWRIRSDGSDATRIAAGTFFLPEVSPDGRYVAFVANDAERAVGRILVARVEDGERVFETTVPFRGFQNTIQPGRVRWMPDGQALVFVGPDRGDNYALYRQDFRPGEDTTASRRLFLEETGDSDIESFGIAPDGQTVTYARISHFRSIKIAEGDFGVSR